MAKTIIELAFTDEQMMTLLHASGYTCTIATRRFRHESLFGDDTEYDMIVPIVYSGTNEFLVADEMSYREKRRLFEDTFKSVLIDKLINL